MYDTTAIRGEGIDDLVRQFPKSKYFSTMATWDSGEIRPGKAVTPPRKLNKTAAPEVHEAREHARHEHSSQRIPVEHSLADHKRWKGLARWTHRRDTLPATYLAVAGLVSDRTATT